MTIRSTRRCGDLWRRYWRPGARPNHGNGIIRSEPSRATVKWPDQSSGCDKTFSTNSLTTCGERRRGRPHGRLKRHQATSVMLRYSEASASIDFTARSFGVPQDDNNARYHARTDLVMPATVSSAPGGVHRFAGCVLIGEESSHVSRAPS